MLESVQEWLEENSMLILRVGQEVLGMSTGKRAPGDKETRWWNDEVKDTIKAKKESKKKWETSGRQDREISVCKQTRRQRKQ